MKTALRSLVIALGLLPALAAAQTFPTVPANTVIGRLGVGTGPSQAIPFSVLSQNMFGTIPNNTVLGNVSGGAALTASLTATQLTTLCNTFTSSLKGCVPASGGGTTSFLRADGTFAVPTSVGTTAANVTYTPQGTGGVATTAKVELDRTIWVNDYGAVCNGVTDDHAAFQNAINLGQTSGLPVRFTGNCAITTALTITAPIDFSGGGTAAGSTILAPGTIDIIDITTAPLTNPGINQNLHDFALTYSTVPTSTSAITINATGGGSNTGSKFQNIQINGAFIGIQFFNAAYWSIINCVINATSVTGASSIFVADAVSPDAGDSTITGSTLQPGPGGFGVKWFTGGGIRIINNKILGNTMLAGLFFQLASGASTGDILIANNSIEGFQASSSVGIGFARSGATGSLGNITINSNQFSAPFICVNHPTDANGTWSSLMIVTGNICALNATAGGVGYNIDSVTGTVVAHNVTQAGVASDVAIFIGTATGASATICAVGPNPKTGTFTANTLGSCTAISPN